MAHHTSTNAGTVATNMDRFNNFQSARPVGSSVWVSNQLYIILYKWKLVFIDLCPNYCCLYRLLGMELSARDSGSATTALQCRWRDSTSGAPDISQGGQLCMGDSHAWNTGFNVWNTPHDVKLSGQHVYNVTPKSSFTKVTMTVS